MTETDRWYIWRTEQARFVIYLLINTADYNALYGYGVTSTPKKTPTLSKREPNLPYNASKSALNFLVIHFIGWSGAVFSQERKFSVHNPVLG